MYLLVKKLFEYIAFPQLLYLRVLDVLIEVDSKLFRVSSAIIKIVDPLSFVIILILTQPRIDKVREFTNSSEVGLAKEFIVFGIHYVPQSSQEVIGYRHISFQYIHFLVCFVILVNKGKEWGPEELQLVRVEFICNLLFIHNTNKFFSVLCFNKIDTSEILLHDPFDQSIGPLIILHVFNQINIILYLHIVQRQLCVFLFYHFVQS